jgi:hypothetical protein
MIDAGSLRVGLLGFALLAAACGSDVVELDGSGGTGGSSSNIGTGSGGSSVGAGASSSTGTATGTGAGTGAGTTGTGTGASGGGTGAGTGTATTTGSTGSGSTGTGSTSTGEPTCPGNGDACSACASDACPSEWCACAANAECPALIACWDACETEECFQDCMSAHTAGISDAVNVQSCASSACPDCQAGWEPLDPCSECMFEDCEGPMNTCLASPACGDLWACLGQCPPIGLTCQQECYEAFGEGTEALQELLTCTESECPICQ